VKVAGAWQAAADTIVLEFDDRHRRRMSMVSTRGIDFLLDLPEAIALRGGDALALDDGRCIEIIAAPEPLIEVRCADAGQLIRVAWHLGNRHLPTQLMRNALRIRRDHVIEEMLRGLGATLIEIDAPFDPEGGAYGGGGHGHRHGDGPGHGHSGHDHHEHDHHGHAHQHGSHEQGAS
jgi:urease accessory protein